MAEKNYHDYVIKDGKFIGQFEEMYKDCKDPWTQSTQPNKYSRMAGIVHMKEYDVQSILECGGGLGYYADWIYRDTGIIPKSIDISQTAIDRAKELFPKLDFEQAELLTYLKNCEQFDCILFSEIMWYILPELQDILEVLKERFSGKLLLINQVFYKGTQKYGNDFFTSRQELIDYIPFKMEAYCEATREEDSTIETAVLFRI